MTKPKKPVSAKTKIDESTAQQLEAMNRGGIGRGREPIREERQEIRQKQQKPLKLDVSAVHRALEKLLGKSIKLKWCTHNGVNYHLENGWEVVQADLKTAINKYTDDGRLKPKSENIQDSEGGAYTADVGNGEYNFLIYKDLEAYTAEDAVWNKTEADRPMDSLYSSSGMGEDAGLGGDVKSYQPSQKVKVDKQRDAY